MHPKPTTLIVDPTSPLGFCLTMLEGLIAGVEAKSEIPVQHNELTTLKLMITRELEAQARQQKPCIALVQDVVLPMTISFDPKPVYPTMASLRAVLDLAYSQLPGVPTNIVFGLFMTYHNTLLKEIERGKDQD